LRAALQPTDEMTYVNGHDAKLIVPTSLKQLNRREQSEPVHLQTFLPWPYPK